MAIELRHLLKDKSAIASLTTLSALAILAYTTRAYWTSSKRLDYAEKKESLASIFNPPILKKNSTFEAVATATATYPEIRTFYHTHPQADKLPDKGKDLPLLVFIHGLGGSLAQFGPLLNSLINVAPCFGIDMPGCGLSAFEPQTYAAYTTQAIVALHKAAIERCCETNGHDKVVLIGHSMGCSISALLVSNTAERGDTLNVTAAGMVAICPKSEPPTQSEAATYRRLLSMPDFLLNIIRWFDRRGGPESTSVKRFVGENAGIDLKMLQLQYNSHLPTAVWKRKALGALPTYNSGIEGEGGMPGRRIWSGLDIPLFMIAGASDSVCPPDNITRIVSYLQENDTSGASIATISAVTEQLSTDKNTTKSEREPKTTATSSHNSHHSAPIKTATLPPPASHALLYSHTTYRTVAGLIEDFFSTSISPHLSQTYQLQTLTTSGKWDVKNLVKWQSVAPVSDPIDHGRFRALKTLRQQDETHTPAVFAKRWAGEIYAVIDISHDTPVYDPKELEEGGIQYHKFPTVSKIPPSDEEVKGFIELVERLRGELEERKEAKTRKAIAVHCHYGYNRTLYLLICCMVEKDGWAVDDAMEEVAKKRPDGIRHAHFLDKLAVKYAGGVTVRES